MKQTLMITACLLHFAAFSQSNVSGSSKITTYIGSGSCASSKQLDKLVAKQVETINKALAVKISCPPLGLNGFFYDTTGNTNCYLKRKVAYPTTCGTDSSFIELYFSPSLKADEFLKKILVKKIKIKPMKAAVYQPRCEDGKLTPNSYNLVWVNEKGQLLNIQ